MVSCLDIVGRCGEKKREKNEEMDFVSVEQKLRFVETLINNTFTRALFDVLISEYFDFTFFGRV